MADPTKYKPHFNYSGWEAAGNKRPKPGAELDIDFANIERSIDETIDALKDIRRSDGKLKNGLVTLDSMETGLLGTFEGYIDEAEQARDDAQTARSEAQTARLGAEDAQEGAETARDIARGYASDAVSQGNVPIYASVATVEGLNINPGITALRTNGYYTPGDGGGALYKRVASEPSHNSKVQSADGSWWVPVVPDGYAFDSVSDMQASRLVTPGARVRTLGYYSPGDGGGIDYEIVAAGTGTDDGGSFIDLSGSGLQAKGLFGNKVSVKAFGAVGDGVNDDFTAIQGAINYQKSQTSGVVWVPVGNYLVSQTVTVRVHVTLEGESTTNWGNGHTTSIIGDGALSPVVSLSRYWDGGSEQPHNACMKNIGVTRNEDMPTPGTEGVEVNGMSSGLLYNVFSWRHAIGFVQRGPGLGNIYNGCLTTKVTQAHMRFEDGPEPTMINCRFGKNGGHDFDCENYIEIDGSTNINTINFIRCQFNQSGGRVTGAGLSFYNYSEPNGIINLIGCHAEGFHADGNHVFLKADANSPIIRRVRLIGCSLHSSSGPNFFDAPGVIFPNFWISSSDISHKINLPSNEESKFLIESSFLDGGLTAGKFSFLSVTTSHIMGSVEFTEQSTGAGAITSCRIGTLVGSVPPTISTVGNTGPLDTGVGKDAPEVNLHVDDYLKGSFLSTGSIEDQEAVLRGFPSVRSNPTDRVWWTVQTVGGSTRCFQVATNMSTGGKDIYVRVLLGTWQPWQKVYVSNNILGTVSQESGVPTGSIFERGSNANGEYVKFADGTMICTRTYTQSGDGTDTIQLGKVDFAAEFITLPVCSVMASVAGTNSYRVTEQRLRPTKDAWNGGYFVFERNVETTTEVDFQLHAIGRWF